jgi:anti-sigma factor ChrR (cupin superfamily)
MIPEDVEALALADAIGALDKDERLELEALVSALSAEEQAEVAGLYDIACSLAAAAPQVDPPARVLDALMAAVAAPAPAAAPPSSNYTLLSSEGEWNQSPFPGITVKILAIDKPRSMVTMLLKGGPGARYPSHRHSTCEECYVLSGSVVIEGRVLRAGDFHHAEGDTDHGEIYTTEGAEVLLVGAIADYLPDYPL